MEKQFELLDKLYEASKESETKIKELNASINLELNKVKNKLLLAYNNDAETMFLVQFDSYILKFYKATKTNLYEVCLTWFKSRKNIVIYPKNINEAKTILSQYSNPTNAQILSYREFGYFDDVKHSYNRLDFIADETHKKRFLFEITEEQFLSAIKCVSNFYGNI